MLLTINEAVKILRVSRPTLAKNAERFGGFKVGNQWRFNERVILEGGQKDGMEQVGRVHR